jgi:hypothetical protein
MVENVQGTVEWAKDKLESFPQLKADLGPLLDALGRTLQVIFSASFYSLSTRTNHANRWWCCAPSFWSAQLAWTARETCFLLMNLNGSPLIQLSGLGLDSLLKGIIAATVSDE